MLQVEAHHLSERTKRIALIEALDSGGVENREHPGLGLLTLGTGDVVRLDEGAEVFGLSCGLDAMP
ncbi:hypothetical protein ACFXGR_51885 [Streptomyces mirabilis]|uniref:hypothetical protein n=1 Tax=Streptomyces mirabilis TaxID=68239 RepID=UPI0036B26341